MAVKVINLDEKIAGLEALANLRTWVKRPLKRANQLLMEEARDYPTKDPGAFTALATPGQKRAYWAKVGSGEIQHGASGYVRTNKLRDSWQEMKIKLAADRAKSGIESNLPGNQYVMGKRQQPFHAKSGWLTDEKLASENEREVDFFFQDEIANFKRGKLA